LFSNKKLIILRGKTLSKRGIIARLKGKTFYLATITRFNIKANIII
jgi:hypothetical protein